MGNSHRSLNARASEQRKGFMDISCGLHQIRSRGGVPDTYPQELAATRVHGLTSPSSVSDSWFRPRVPNAFWASKVECGAGSDLLRFLPENLPGPEIDDLFLRARDSDRSLLYLLHFVSKSGNAFKNPKHGHRPDRVRSDPPSPSRNVN
jgi:hypothetical protein